MVLKRVPSFSSRPGFPHGLKVFVLESDTKHSEYIQAQLQECSYEVHTCCTVQELVQLSQSELCCDVVLAEFKTLNNAACDAGMVDFLKSTPLVLMSECPSTEDILSGVKLGAVEVLEKPVSQTKLRTLWQHTVRKMMSCLSFTAITDSCNEQPSLLVIPEFDMPLSPGRSGVSNSSNGDQTTEGDTDQSSQSQAADNMDISEISALTRQASINSSRSSSPDLRKRKSMDGLDHPKCKSTKESIVASPAPVPAQPTHSPVAHAAAAAAAAAPVATPVAAPVATPVAAPVSCVPGVHQSQHMVPQVMAMGMHAQVQEDMHKSSMAAAMSAAMPQPPAALMNMLASGFRPPTAPMTPLPPGMVWGLPMPPPGLMFPPGFIPPPFPAGFPIPPPLMSNCFPPVCSRPPMHMATNPALSMPPPPAPMPTMPQLPHPVAPVTLPTPCPTLMTLDPTATLSPAPPALTLTSCPSSTSQDTFLTAHSVPHSHPVDPSSPALHPSPSLVSLDVAESADPDDKQGVALGMGIAHCPLPVEVIEDSFEDLPDLPNLDVAGDTTALLFSDWLLDDGEPDVGDVPVLGLHLKKTNSFADLINDHLCTFITAAG